MMNDDRWATLPAAARARWLAQATSDATDQWRRLVDEVVDEANQDAQKLFAEMLDWVDERLQIWPEAQDG